MVQEKNNQTKEKDSEEVAPKKKRGRKPGSKNTKTTTKTVKKTNLSVRVVSKKTDIKDDHEEDTLKNIKTEDSIAEKGESIGEEREFFKKTGKRIEQDDIKSQKASEKKEKVVKEKVEEPRSVSLYRKLSFFFIALTILLLSSIFYFYFVSLTVEVVPKKEGKADKVSFSVALSQEKEEQTSTKESIEGVVEQIPVKEDGVFQPTGAKVLGKEIVGKVVIHNNKADKQILIATTRLMSPDGKIYRIKDRVEIQPNGQVEVGIYTDEPSEEMAIGPSRFILPALWSGLQDKVYAESKEAFIYNTQIEKYIQQVDIDKGLQDLKASLVEKASRQFSDNYKGYDKVMFEIDKNSLKVETSGKANDKADELKIEISTNVNIIAFNKADAEKLAEERFLSKIETDKKVLGIDKGGIQYSLSNTDFVAGKAVVEASFMGFLSAKKGDTLIDREKLVGLNEAQIKEYLSSSDDFSEFNIKITPSFMKKAPILVDRIKVIIKE